MATRMIMARAKPRTTKAMTTKMLEKKIPPIKNLTRSHWSHKNRKNNEIAPRKRSLKKRILTLKQASATTTMVKKNLQPKRPRMAANSVILQDWLADCAGLYILGVDSGAGVRGIIQLNYAKCT